MTIRELTCLVHLFQACVDPVLRRRAIELVPELSEWDKIDGVTQLRRHGQIYQDKIWPLGKDRRGIE